MKSLVLIATLFLSLSLFASNTDTFSKGYKDYYEIDSATVTELDNGSVNELSFYNEPYLSISLGDIINTGEKIWQIIKANKPVFESQQKWSSALPSGVNSGFDLQGWRMPKSHTYRFAANNRYGVNVVDLTFKVVYTYGGSLNGKGQYLMNVSVVPTEVDVLIGFKAHVTVEVPEVFNMGTQMSPVAGMTVLVKTQIETPLQLRTTTQVFTVNGNGEIAQQ